MKRVIVLSCALIALLAMTAFAQDPEKRTNFYLGAGVSLPMGDFGDAYGMGLHANVGLGIKVMATNPNFQIVPSVGFHTFSIDEDAFTAAFPNADGGTLNAILLGADVRYGFGVPEASMHPFILGGIGFGLLNTGDITYDNPTPPPARATVTFDNANELYFNFGAGVDFAAGDALQLFLMARYLSIMTEGESTNVIPITIGIKF